MIGAVLAATVSLATTPGNVSPAWQDLPAEDVAILDDLQKRAVDFFWRESHPETGLTKDRAANYADRDDFNVSSVASVGFAMIAYPLGVERGWLPRDEALARTRRTIRTMVETVEHKNGFSYHFVNWATGKREWKSEASTIDTSIALAGILFARQYWRDTEVSRWADAYVKRIDWQWAMTNGGERPQSGSIVHGWRPEEGFLNGRWDNFDELKMLYIQAYGLSDVSTHGWKEIIRDVVTFEGLEFIRGGPLFIHQMSESFYDFRRLRDGLGFDYAVETTNATLANRMYAIKNPQGFKAYGPNYWGLSASDGPDGYNAFGAPGWINDNGTITPTSPIASLPFTPRESMDFARHMVKTYPELLGRYGFPNGVNPTRNWRGPDVIGIDLGMMMCGIENYRNEFVWRFTRQDEAIQRGFRRAGFRPGNPSDDGKLRVKVD